MSTRRGEQLRLVREDLFAFGDGDGDDGWVYARRPDGTLESLGRALGGFDAGLSLSWYPDGVAESESDVEPGVVHRYRTWHRNGLLASDGGRHWHEDGSPADGPPSRSERLGAARSALADPEVRDVGALTRRGGTYWWRGAPYTGPAALFDVDGVLAALLTFAAGRVFAHRWWYRDGTREGVTDAEAELAARRPGPDPRRVGPAVGWRVTRHPNRMVRVRERVVLGPRREFHPDGTPAGEYRVALGRRTGAWRRWHPNGVLAEAGDHADDGTERRDGVWLPTRAVRRPQPDPIPMGPDGRRVLVTRDRVVVGRDGRLRLDGEVFSGEIVEDGRGGLVRSLMRVGDGRPHGAHLRWYDSGWLAQDSVWECGRLVRRDRWPDR